MKLFKNMARSLHKIIPEGRLKNKLSAMAYQALYKNSLKDYRYSDGRFEVHLNNGIELLSIKEFDPEPLIAELSEYDFSKSKVVCDLGGHFGLVGIYMAKVMSGKGQVYVYEADPVNYKILMQNIKLNGVNNITAVNKGVYDKKDKIEFFSGGSYLSSFQHTNYVDQKKEKFQVTSIDVVPLDAEMKAFDIKSLDFIKIDIEGSEVHAVRGAKTILKKYHPDLMIETHIVEEKSTYEPLKALLIELGYNEFRFDKDEKNNPTIFATLKKK